MATSASSIFPALAQLDIGDVLAHMPGGFFVYHADGDEAVVYVNEACLRIFGCADEEQFVALTGGTFPGMVHPEDIEAVEHSISRQIQADRYSMDYVEYRIIRRDGSVRWIEDYGHHVTLDAGEFFYVFINDATDKLRERADELEAVNAQLREAYARELEHRTMLRNALSEAEAANVAKNTFLSNMSHDIRTPLNAVVGYASLISAHGGEAERVRAYSDKVLAASEQLLDVVNETLEISRMEAGHVQLAEAECSLSELVLQARMDMVDLADRADVTLACDIEPLAHDRVLVDAVRLSHVLTQLVDNAIKYSPAGSTVRISVAENAGAPQGFEYNGMPAAGTASFLIVIWMPGYRDLFPTKGTITVLGSAAFIAIEDEIFPHSHLINPARPILGQFRHLSQILIPRAGNSFMPLLQLFVPYISLKIKDTEITAAFPTKIVLYYGSIFLTGPAGGIIVSPRPIQPVQFGVPPFFL